jgi:hypothetical protein
MGAEEALKDALSEPQSAQPIEVEGERDRSTIGFPYGDLDDAVAIATGVHGLGGSGCEVEQLAAKMNQSATGGGFRQQLLTAKVFGVATYTQGRITLSALGSRICDPKQANTAKTEAFLTVPLYKAVYDKFKSGTLPPAAGLEAEMVTLGVAKKQTGKARQVFQRSAMQAGFFWSGQDRLVMPPAGNGAPEKSRSDTPLTEDHKPPKGNGGGGDGGGVDCDPAIMGLIKRLPPPDTDWAIEKQVRWLLAISHAFDVVYPREDGRSLKIEIVGE